MTLRFVAQIEPPIGQCPPTKADALPLEETPLTGLFLVTFVH